MFGPNDIPLITDLSTGKTYALSSFRIENDPMGYLLPEVKISFMRDDGVMFDVNFRRYGKEPKFEILYGNGEKVVV